MDEEKVPSAYLSQREVKLKMETDGKLT